ncbi:MAG: hypothetical protein FWC15_03425 [Fibromonadales bacterium]|nr:hypothetical protein [Fibromonadales bacterium]
MALNINDLYQYFKESNSFSEHGIDQVASLLGLDTLNISELTLYEPVRNSFKASGMLTYGSQKLHITINVTAGDNRYHYKIRAHSNGGQLLDLFDIPGARTADSFYGIRETKWFEHIEVVDNIVWADTLHNEAGMEISLKFSDENLLVQRYAILMPKANTTVIFSGAVEKPMANGKKLLNLTGHYPISAALPFANVTPLKEAALTIDNNVFDDMDMGNYPLDPKREQICMTTLKWQGRVDLKYNGLNNIWVSFNIFNHAQRFDLDVTFGEDGFSIENLVGLLTTLAGRSEMVELPSWFILKNIAVYGLVFRMQKNIGEAPAWHGNENSANADGLLDGVAISMGLALPSIPIPFFNAESGSKVTLFIHWDGLSLNFPPMAIIAFKAKWREYALTFNVTVPQWIVEARLFKDPENTALLARQGNEIFPGFLGLSIKDIRVYGDFREESYSVGIALENETGISFPFAGKKFAITSAEGGFSYSTLGLEIALSLGFKLFEADFYISGTYKKQGEQTLVSFGGGLYKPLKLSAFLNNMLGITLPESLELNISALRLSYTALLNENEELSNSENRSFTFFCAVDFHWDILPNDNDLTIESTFLLNWRKNKTSEHTNLSIEAILTLMKFKVAAAVELKNDGSDMKLDNYKFRIVLRNNTLEAYGNNKVIVFDIKRINIGELIEGIIIIISRNSNWYLPWPFKILKNFTLENLKIKFDNENRKIIATYSPNLKILFFTLEAIELTYDQKDETFELDLKLSGLPEQIGSGNFPLDLLNNKFPDFYFLGSPLFKLNYLGIGQHVSVKLPDVIDGESIPKALNELKSAIKKDGAPVLDMANNWLVGMDILLLNSIEAAVLMCDPNFYGLRIGIKKGSSITEKFTGLELVVLYRKVTDSIGVFQGILSIPEKFRRFELGAVSITIGQISLAIYTNGNFMIDLGFPHNNDFSRSFGLEFGPFSGQGGFYLGVLNGQTSQNVPKVRAGNFGTVVELGIGVSAGIGRTIRKGPLKAAAYIRVIGIFKGVFSAYTPPGKDDSYTFYRISATVGLTAKISGEVDFIVISVGLSIEFTATAALTLESYRAGNLALSVELKVGAYVKILFVKISFSFSFTWKDSFTIGKNETAPWDAYLAVPAMQTVDYKPDFRVNWSDKNVLGDIQTLEAELVPYFSYDGIPLDGKGGRHKIGWVACLSTTTPLAILVKATLLRIFNSYGISGNVDTQIISALEEDFAVNGHEGFTMEHLDRFFEANLVFCLIDSKDSGFGEEIHGIPMPCPPVLKLSWKTGEEELTFDLSVEPEVPENFSKLIREYFEELSTLETQKNDAAYAQSKRNSILSASTVLFCDYFYMLAKLSIAQAQKLLEAEGGMTVSNLIDKIVKNAFLDNISGQLSRFLMGGLRAPQDNGLISLYEFAHQQFNGTALDPKADPKAEAHSLAVSNFNNTAWVALGKRDNEFSTYSAVESLTIPLKNEDLAYPTGSFNLPEPQMLPLHFWKQAVTELKPPIALDSGLLYELDDFLLKKNYYVAYYDKDYAEHKLEHTAVFTVRIPLLQGNDDSYSICPIGKASMEALRRLKGANIATISFYRETNEIDHSSESNDIPEGTELIRLESENAFLYRSNLCLEAEKPELSQANNEFVNSAWANTQSETFINLLSDACLVNSRGYFLHCEIPDHVAEDGSVTLTILVETDGKKDGNAIIIKADIFDSTEYKPVIIDDKKVSQPALPQGLVAFSLSMPEPGETDPLKNNFNTLTFSVQKKGIFSKSKESLPVMPQNNNDGIWRYQQIVPVNRFIDGDDPYRGIADKADFTLNFALMDILGNRTANCLSLTKRYGYYDHLIPPSAYPNTQCSYGLSCEENKVMLTLKFTYVEDSDSDADLDTPYHQLKQSDAQLSVLAFGTWHQIQDKNSLVNFLGKIAGGEKPQDAVIRIATNQSTMLNAPLPADIVLRITRSEELLVPSLRDDLAGEPVRVISCPIIFDGETANNLGLAKDCNGAVYLVPIVKPSFSQPSYWTVPPLSTTLITVSNVDVKGNKVSFADVDPEIWMDVFLRDVEQVISPASALRKNENYQKYLEGLLSSKKNLANVLAGFVTNITNITGDIANAKDAAKNTFHQSMLRNLHLGRQIDAVAVLNSTDTPQQDGMAYVGQVSASVDVSVGKITRNKPVAIPVRVNDITAQKKMEIGLTYTLTDWEVQSNGDYNYLSLLTPYKNDVTIDVPLPYKRYPDKAELHSHSGESAWISGKEPKKLFSWDYELRLIHKTAAQDIITVEIIDGNESLIREPQSDLWTALAGYMYRREALLSKLESEEVAEEFVEAVNKIAKALEKHSVEKNTNTQAERFAFEVKRSEGVISVYDSNLKQMPKFAVQIEDGSFTDLVYDKATKTYALPKEFAQEAIRYKISFGGYQIAQRNLTNANVTITRNAGIDSINPIFIYQTPPSTFTSCLKPAVKIRRPINYGLWTKDNFAETVKQLWEDFGSVNIELVYARQMAFGIHSLIPVIYMPTVTTTKDLELIHSEAETWLKSHVTAANGDLIQCSITFFSKNNAYYNLAELSTVQFDFFAH